MRFRAFVVFNPGLSSPTNSRPRRTQDHIFPYKDLAGTTVALPFSDPKNDFSAIRARRQSCQYRWIDLNPHLVISRHMTRSKPPFNECWCFKFNAEVADLNRITWSRLHTFAPSAMVNPGSVLQNPAASWITRTAIERLYSAVI